MDNANGVVHIINKVLLPQEVLDALQMEEEGNLVDLVIATKSLSLLEQAVIKAGLVETLMSEGPFTVFAPTDDAFVALLDLLGDQYNRLDDFDTEEEKALLAEVLKYHVVTNLKLESGDIQSHIQLHTLQGEDLTVRRIYTNRIVLDDSTNRYIRVIGADNEATNGIVHLINQVLLPVEVLQALH